MTDSKLDRTLQQALRPLNVSASQRRRYQALLDGGDRTAPTFRQRRSLAEFGVIAAALVALIFSVVWWQQGQSSDGNSGALALFTLSPTLSSTPAPMLAATHTPTIAPTPTLESVPATPPATCPVTRPDSGSAFVPAEPYPATAPELYDAAWYGSDALWTMVNPEGEIWAGLPYDDGFSQKTFWWRAGYEPLDEPRPAISVTGRRLDKPGPTFEAGNPGTHGMRTDIGSFMLVGVSIPTPGCWEITGHYDGAELSYVVWVTGAS